MTAPVKDAIVVLGCRVGRDGAPSGPLQRRCERAAQAFHDRLAGVVVACGGKSWDGHREAEVMSRVLQDLGVPEGRIVCELESRTTWGNAVHGAKVLRHLEVRKIALVTCDFHQTRALSAFERLGFDAVGLACPTPGGGPPRLRRFREALFALIQPAASWLAWLLLVSLVGCNTDGGRGAAGSASASGAPSLAASAPSPQDRLFVAGAELGGVVATLAHGCSRPSLVPSLLARASTLSLEDATEPFDRWNPLAQVLGYCDPNSEHLLAGWIDQPTGRARAGARAVAAMASRARRLDPRTVIALLRRPEFEETWFALSQLDVTSTSLENRVLEQAVATLKTTSLRPYWVLRALARVGDEAVPLLLEYAADAKRDLGVRTAAATSLSVLGTAGQQALATLVDEPDPAFALRVLALLDPAFAPRAALDKRLAAAAPSTPTEAALRCAVAAKVSPLDHFDACAPSQPRLQQLAWLEAFDTRIAADLRPSRSFRKMFDDADPVVVQAALDVLARAPKRPEYDEVIRRSLAHTNPGVVARAAEVLSRVARSNPTLPPSRDTVQALKEALLRNPGAAPVPTLVALLHASSSLEVLSLRGALPQLCDADSSAVHRAVDDALLELHAERCPPRVERAVTEARTTVPSSPARRLHLRIDGADLLIQLSPDLPSDVEARLSSWLRDGGFAQSRVVVAPTREWLRVGDAEGDDYPDARSPTLTSMPRGAAFGRYSVALWQHGIDAASLELVVALEDRPDFDADHTFIGTADATWEQVQVGATVERASSEP